MKALSGEQAPGVGGVGVQLQAQVSTLGWRIDDLLLTSDANGGRCRLAISAKGNQQVSSSGLPSDFVTGAWEQWRDTQGPFNRAADGLALVTLGTLQAFDAPWREVKNACSGPDVALAISRIRSNPKQSRVFNSVQKPGGTATEEETIELIRRLHVLPVDLQSAHSETQSQAIAQCRRLLASGNASDADELWKALVNVAKDVRLRKGTITVQDLWSLLRRQFELRHHPDFERDWETLSNVTTDHKVRIETELPSGYAVPRNAEKASFKAAVAENAVTVVFGESGCGKSALVKSVLDSEFPTWNQVWFGPEELKTALSAARRRSLPLRHELSRVLNATVKPANVLVIDSAERIEATEFIVIRQLLHSILPSEERAAEGTWRVVVVTQTQGWVEGEETLLGGRKARLVELEQISSEAVKLALLRSSTLGWLAGHDDTIAALTNLRTLAWVIKAGAALGSNPSGLASHTAIADRLWKYWTQDRADVQALMMRLAKREASFERSFALTDLDPVDTTTFAQRPAGLPLCLNERTNRVEFEHDLAADWARFQALKQIWTDTPQWAALAENPLWTNALRMLGQFLLRQADEDATAWDTAFQAAAANNGLASDILLDALCLDPDAERFLTERVELLFANNAEVFSRLLRRFHHVATVPAGSPLALNSAAGLYMEAKFRSVIYGRWPPVLRFLIAQSERLGRLASSALAKVIETWLRMTPHELCNGALMPYRREMAGIALAMARTVQVQKGHGVIYLTREHVLYTAPLAGAADLPEEVGNWALELAGRREVDPDVTRRIAEVRREKAKADAERLKTDPEYRAQQQERRQESRSIGSFRERLPPWPLGASRKVDVDFREACIQENGIQPLMRAQPELAAEVLLALIIEDEPEHEYGSVRHEVDLGLEYSRDGYPTAFWKSAFFLFLQIAPDEALGALIALVNFCTERWAAEVMQGREETPPGLPLQLGDGSEKTFQGWWQAFDWVQSNSTSNGNLFSALDALERWLILRLDAGENISAAINRLLHEGNSTAFISVLVNVAKYQPLLLKDVLAPLLTSPIPLYWDSSRVDQITRNFIAWSWLRDGEAVFNFARDWTLAPHRKKKFFDVTVELLMADYDVARRLQSLIPTWSLPEDPKEELEFKLLYAALDRTNYQTATDPETGSEVPVFVCPDELNREVLSWQSEKAEPLEYLLAPYRCEKRLESGQPLSDEEATYLYDVLKACEADAVEDEDESGKSTCRLAAAATLIVLGGDWLRNAPGAQAQALATVRTSVSEIPSAWDEISKRRMASDELKFASRAVMHLWLDSDASPEWETGVLRLLTSGDARATATVVSVAYAHRQKLGSAWWRLVQVGVLWSGLVLLTPHHGDGEAAKRAWNVWLARLRRLPLRGRNTTPDDLDFKRVATGCGRLQFDRAVRLYTSGDRTWYGKPERRPGVTLDGQFLGVLFSWLIDGEGTGDRSLDTRLALRIWDYDAARAKARAKKDRRGEYDLPTQNLGYDVLLKLAALSIAAPNGERQAVWEPVLAHGPAAHYALQSFIDGLYLCLGKGADPAAFERLWRDVAEYALGSDWSKPGLWFYGERLLCGLLGFGNENSLSRLAPGAALRMKDVYERWAQGHLARDEECVTRFSRFLTTSFGAPLRLHGLRWLAAMLKAKKPSDHWYREGTGNALVELVAVTLSSDAQSLSKDADARQALVETAAALAAKNIPEALALQEHIKLLR